MVSAWNVGELDQMVLPPCHYGFQIYTRLTTREEKIVNPGKYRAISLMWNQRSVDTFLGLPFNIASYGLLLEIIAESVNMIPDELIGNLGDVHLYNNHIEQAKEQCNRTPYDLPKLNINTEFWPTENSSCGEGLLDTSAIFEAFKNDNFCRCLLEEDLQLYDYQSHPAIKAPLSN
jgi:thymidylate synthase